MKYNYTVFLCMWTFTAMKKISFPREAAVDSRLYEMNILTAFYAKNISIIKTFFIGFNIAL